MNILVEARLYPPPNRLASNGEKKPLFVRKVKVLIPCPFLRPVLEGFKEVRGSDCFCASEVGNGARELNEPMIDTRREVEP